MAFSVLEKIESYDRLMDTDELAEALGLSRKVIYRIAMSGELPSLKIAGGRRFDPLTISHWIRKQHPSFAKARREAQQCT